MDTISKDTLMNLIAEQQGMTTSIFMPAFTAEPEARQNPIRLKTLISKAEEKLKTGNMDPDEIETYLKPLSDLVDDEIFWQDKSKGLALFLDENKLISFDLPVEFEEFVEVGESFHITPLIPIYKGNGQFYLLSLNKERPNIYKGSKYSLYKIEELDLPKDLQTLFDEFYEFHQHMQFHSKTRSPSPDASQTTGAREGVFFGHGGEDIDEEAELRNFYHRFDEALMDYLDGEDAPLVLGGIDSLHPIYKEANTYPHLLEEGISKDVEHMPVDELHEMAWDIVKDQYQTDIQKALGVFHSLEENEDKTTKDIGMIISAAYFKRINTLFLADDAHIWGVFKPDENEIRIDEQQSAKNHDLLNFAAIHSLKNGGNVLSLEPNEVPGGGKAAAILRY
jgi:hypothetical protein